jgi:uncharacterized 2Fe-2S/4Fe-4S cluster protein (DUF4445 family)
MRENEPLKEDTVLITVEGVGSYKVPAGSNLRETLRREGVYIDGTCADNGTCGRCVVRVVDGDAGEPSLQEKGILGDRSVSDGQRLACRIMVKGDLEVAIDPERMLEIDSTGKWKEVWDSPLWRPELLKAGGDGYGVAVDLGTTSIASALLDLSRNRPLDIRTSANPQMPWGDEIISRLGAAAGDHGIAARLRILTWNTVKDQVRSLCLRSGVPGGRINRLVVVGNSAMHHLAFGFPVEELLKPPYSPSRISSTVLTPEKLPVKLEVNRQAEIYSPPLIGGFAGSDALASLLAAKTSGVKRGALLDVGTNTEIAVWENDSIQVATAPSGPAFEGGHILSGMRAEEGAIWKVSISGETVHCEVVGGVQARGICGTGMIDAVASMLRNGILDRSGLLNAGSHPMVKGGAFVLDTDGGVALKNVDMATIQKAKSAVASAFKVLLKIMALEPDSLDKIFIAGAFGSRLNIKNAVATGLFPDVPVERYILAGNAALAGAAMMLVSEGMRQRAESIARSAKHCDLTVDPEFEEAFINNLYFPGD